MSNALQTLTSKLAVSLGMTDGAGLVETLKATAFRGAPVNDAQMTALMVVANQYGLNPWTREIYAFPDKGGIVPVVGLDGWSRIINNHPQFDGMDFEQDADSCTCIIHRKDRSHPVRVTEYMEECKRNTGPWQSHPRRMLRHKAMIQSARLAFGFTGIFEQDEAERIVEAQAPKRVDPDTGEIEAIVFDVTAALDAVEQAATLDALLVVWKSESAKAAAAQDKGGYAAVKDAVKQKRTQLENITDVEVSQ